jgi:hypothetical protein
MECKLDVNVYGPEEKGMLFRPYVLFRIEQLNLTPQCMTDIEIDEQVNMLIRDVEKLRKKAKKALKEALSRHDELLRRKKEGS